MRDHGILVAVLLGSTIGAACAGAQQSATPSASAQPTTSEPDFILRPAASFDYERNALGDNVDRLQPVIEEGLDRSGSQHRPKFPAFSAEYLFESPASIEKGPGSIAIHELAVGYRIGGPPVFGRFFPMARPIAEVVWFVDGPETLDLPGSVYKFAVEFGGRVQWNERLGTLLAVTPGLWSDLHDVDAGDIRVPAILLADYRVNDSFTVVGGLVWTDNADSQVFPGVGLVLSPNDRTRVDLVFPRPKVSYQLNPAWKIHGLFEFDFATYDIQRGGRNDELEVRDYRVLFGAEHRVGEMLKLVAESGVAFGRELRFQTRPDVDLSPAWTLRLGLQF